MTIKKTTRNSLFLGILFILSFLINHSYATYDKFLDNTFWNSNPTTGEIISALYGIDSIYTSNWTGYDTNSCENMQVEYPTTLPDTLNENTIYVLSSDLELSNQITFAKCSAVVGNGDIEITTISNGMFAFYIDKPYSIVDNISINTGTTHCGIWGDNINGITINNISINNMACGIALNSVNYGYLNDISISNNLGNHNSDIIEGEGLIVINGNYNIIKNINSYNNRYGIQLYSHSDHNFLENLKLYDNIIFGLGIDTNNNYNIINNVISYNNNENGIGIYNNSNYNSFNNIQSFNNGKSSPYAGFLIDASDNNIINNSVFYNNTKGIGNRDDRPGKNNIFINVSVYNNKLFGSSISGNNNKYYGILNSFANGGNNEFTVLEKGDSTGILPEGQLTGGELSRDLITNPKNKSKYILDWSKSLSGNRGVNEKFNNKAISYSFGTKIPTQSELYVWDGDEIITIGTANDNYIGSNTKKIEGKFLTNGINIVGTTTSENINKRIYLNTPGISGDINTYQGLDDNLTKNQTKSNTKSINPGNTEPMIGQFVIKGGNYMHTIAEEDTIAPTCNIKYSTTNTTSSNIIASLSDCSEYITGTELSHTFTTNGKYTFTFYDAIGNTGTTEAEVTWIYKATNGGGGGGGSYTQKPEETGNDTKNDEEEKKDNEFLFNKETFDQQYSDEINMGYQRSYASSITTKKTIKESETDQPLTRIAMAKMLSQYAINVLGEKPDTTRIINFYDISSELDANYNSGVTLAYQLGIMGINMPNNNFRPFDFVTRAEFGTALSRLLFNIDDGIDFYYSPHLHKLAMEGIISNTNPDLQELRGYVMLMLMRSYLGIDKIENDNIVETKYNEESSQQINKYFTEPYRKGQIYKKIGDLQDLLRYLGFYKGKSNSVYNKATINAVYNFQIAMGLIDINDINNPAKGYLGPATRKVLNEKRVEFQLNNK